MDILEGFVVVVDLELLLLHLYLEGLVYIFCFLYYLLYFVLDELELLLQCQDLAVFVQFTDLQLFLLDSVVRFGAGITVVIVVISELFFGLVGVVAFGLEPIRRGEVRTVLGVLCLVVLPLLLLAVSLDRMQHGYLAASFSCQTSAAVDEDC